MMPSNIRKLLGIKWYHHVWNDMRWNKQATTPFRYSPNMAFLPVSHNAQMPGETDGTKILTASLFENWRRRAGCSHTTWMKTIQQDLKSNNQSLNEATDMAQNRPLWRLMSMFSDMHS